MKEEKQKAKEAEKNALKLKKQIDEMIDIN